MKLLLSQGRNWIGWQWLYVFLIGLAIEFASLLASLCAVGSKATVVLVAVQLEHIDGLAVRAPCDVGEVAVCRVASLQIDGLSGHAVEHAYGHLDERSRQPSDICLERE